MNRKLVAMLVMFIWLAAWVVGVTMIGSRMTEWNQAIQLLFYLIAGLGWIFPLRPIFRWMNAKETGPED